MKLEEEISLFQYCQGVLPYDELLGRLLPQEERKNSRTLMDIAGLLERLRPTQSEVDQAFPDNFIPFGKDCSESSFMGMVHHSNDGYTLGLTLRLSEPEATFKSLVSLLKTAYLRRYQADKGSPAAWWFQDLSDPAFVDELLNRHKTLLEEVYNNPEFRDDFLALAQIRHEEFEEMLTPPTESVPISLPENFDPTNLLSYDELMTQSLLGAIPPQADKFATLYNSVGDAIAARYGLDEDIRLKVLQVTLDRHLGEQYNEDFWS